jgi:hypothetical protein
MKKTPATQVTRKAVKKLTPNDLKNITAGAGCRDCSGPSQVTCLAYIVTSSTIVKDPV